LGVVIESRETFNLRTPRSLIRGIIHHPGIARKVSKRKEHLSGYCGTQEEEEFSPTATRLVEETVKSVFLSLKNGMSGLEVEDTRDVFLSKSEKKDHLKDVFHWYSFLFTDGAFTKKLVQFKLLHKGGKHW